MHLNAVLAQCLSAMACEIKKYAADEATEEAAQGIADRNNHLHECEEVDRLNQLKGKIEQYKQKADMYKAKYKQAKKIVWREARDCTKVHQHEI